MKKMLLASALALGAAMASPAAADIIQVPWSGIQGGNVLYNQGGMTGNVVNGFLNNQANTTVVFTGADGAILRAFGGQASVSGDLDTSTSEPNDTLLINGLDFGLEESALFNNLEFNLFGGTATSANFVVTDNEGQVFNFSGDLGTGSNFFGFQGINGQSIRNIAFTTVGGGIQDLRQVRLDLASGSGGGGGSGNEVPEPATWAMLLAGFGMVGATARRRKRTGIVNA